MTTTSQHYIERDSDSTTQDRKTIAAIIASGLLAAHGIDAGGATPELIATQALAIADAIIKAADGSAAQSEHKPETAKKE